MTEDRTIHFLQSREQPFPYYGQRSYIIQLDLRLKHNPLQRHIWFRQDGSVEVEDWISTITLNSLHREINDGYWTVINKLEVPVSSINPNQLSMF